MMSFIWAGLGSTGERSRSGRRAAHPPCRHVRRFGLASWWAIGGHAVSYSDSRCWRHKVGVQAVASELSRYWRWSGAGFTGRAPEQRHPVAASYLWNVPTVGFHQVLCNQPTLLTFTFHSCCGSRTPLPTGLFGICLLSRSSSPLSSYHRTTTRPGFFPTNIRTPAGMQVV